MQRDLLQRQIQEQLATQISVLGSQNELARRADVSPGTLINIKNGNWDKISDEMLNKLKVYFGISDWPIRDTANFSSIVELCADAQRNHRYMAICGFTGAGKTTATKYYAQNNSTVFYFHAFTFQGQRGFLAGIQRSMGINQGGSIEKMVMAIIEQLKKLTSPLLIIDNADKMSDANLMILMAIYDATEGHAGIVLSGTEYLKDMIDKGVRNNKRGYRETARRIAYWQPMERPSDDIINRICEDNGITNTGAKKFIRQHATNYGTLKNMVLNSVVAAEKNDVPVTRDLLCTLSLGDARYKEYAV